MHPLDRRDQPLLPLRLPKIYPITDVSISGLPHAEQVERLIQGGARLIQLREKYASPREFYEAAEKAVELASQHDVTIIINDRVDISFALKTGVHLGQTDLPPVEARRILGPNAIIGYSTHSIEQVREAMTFPVDYIAIGPVFATGTKPDTEPVVGLDGIRAVRSLIGEIPLVAIGGINDANIRSVIEAGADSAAVISAVVADAGKIVDRMRHLTDLADNI